MDIKMSYLENIPGELINLFDLRLCELIRLSMVSKTLSSLITPTDVPERSLHIKVREEIIYKLTMKSWSKFLDHVKLKNDTLEYISLFTRVHTLDLSWTKVSDVSMLGHVHTLNLRGTKVSDVSALVSVHTLYL